MKTLADVVKIDFEVFEMCIEVGGKDLLFLKLFCGGCFFSATKLYTKEKLL